MKKILISLSIIGVVSAIVIGGTWAYFSDRAEVKGNTFSTSNVDLEIRLVGSGQGWQKIVTGKTWENLYPGWSESYEVQLRNQSVSEIGLDIIPKMVLKSDPGSYLRNAITLQFFEGGEPRGPEQTLAEWVNNDNPIEYIQGQQEGKIWTVMFKFPDTGEDQNDLQGKTITFDLVFDGIQTGAPLTMVTNIDTGYSHISDIQNVINNANPGDTILVPEGSYAGNLSINIENLTLAGHVLYFGEAIVEGTINLGPSSNGTTIEGLKIETAGDGIYLAANCPNNLTIKDNVFETEKMGVRRYTESSPPVRGACPLENIVITGNIASGGDKNDTANQGIMILGELTGTTIISNNYTEGKFVAINLGAPPVGVRDSFEFKNNTAVNCGQGFAEIAAWVDTTATVELGGNNPAAVIGDVNY